MFLSERHDLNHIMVLSENFIALSFCKKSHNLLCQLPSVDQLIPFQLTNHRKTLLKLYLLRKIDIDLLNHYLENLIDSYIIYLYPIERHLLGHELPFQ